MSVADGIAGIVGDLHLAGPSIGTAAFVGTVISSMFFRRLSEPPEPCPARAARQQGADFLVGILCDGGQNVGEDLEVRVEDLRGVRD